MKENNSALLWLNHTQIPFLNQPVLSNERKVTCSWNQGGLYWWSLRKTDVKISLTGNEWKFIDI